MLAVMGDCIQRFKLFSLRSKYKFHCRFLSAYQALLFRPSKFASFFVYSLHAHDPARQGAGMAILTNSIWMDKVWMFSVPPNSPVTPWALECFRRPFFGSLFFSLTGGGGASRNGFLQAGPARYSATGARVLCYGTSLVLVDTSNGAL